MFFMMLLLLLLGLWTLPDRLEPWGVLARRHICVYCYTGDFDSVLKKSVT